MRQTCIAFLFFILMLTLGSCETAEQKEERLAKKYCSSCHLFPDANLLGKRTWQRHVLPQMELRMGLDLSLISTIPDDDLAIVLSTIPDKPMVSTEEWQAIQNYYINNAPDTLTINVSAISDTTLPFIAGKIRLPIHDTPLATLIKADTIHHHIYYGNRLGKLYKLSNDFNILDSFALRSPAADMIFSEHNDPLVLMMGIMDPNDQPKGEVASLNLQTGSLTTIIDSLKRPVHFESLDLNNDGLDDFIICAFGNFTGALLAYEQQKNGQFKKHVLQYLPGARNVIIKDFDNNGLKDIAALMTQGDEKIVLLHNQGNFKFRMTTLLRFPPVYGSSYFDIADFNGDGKFDILYTNGDNADYSTVLKPYHGVRIFLNNGTNQFREDWFHSMHGASKAIAQDFDNDGDLDIAAISFFPDFERHPEQSFIYFENARGKFIPKITKLASAGRWLVMEATDLDSDGDIDIVLGALNFTGRVPQNLLDQWRVDQANILLLKNQSSPTQ